MSRDELTTTTKLTTEDGERYELNYFIRVFDSGNERIFALRVDKTGSDGHTVTESTPAFSDDYERIKRLAKFFADGQVTPGVLVEMCDEWA